MSDVSPLLRTLALLDSGMRDGLHVGAQLYASLRGQGVANFAFGEARPGVAMTTDTIMPWMSCSKPVAAVALAQLRERGAIDFDDRVAHHIPEFGNRGKEVITIRQILMHTSGVRAPALGWERGPWEQIISAICETSLQPGWVVGEKAGYSPAVSWYVLAEVVRRADGRPYEQYVRDEIFLPLGMRDSWIGMPAERYRAYGERIGLMHNTSRSPAVAPDPADDEHDATRCRPGGGGRGPMRELGRFYEMLLAGGENVLSRQSVTELTSRHRAGLFDHTFRHVIDWGLGFIIDSNRYGAETVPYGFGRRASEETFGHGGSQSSTSFADPKHGLVVALVWNGMPGEPKHQQRSRETLTALYEDLGLL
ncbi:MAG: serine hydrolase domain-containing protein [Tepidisphaeraceae bacterium]